MANHASGRCDGHHKIVDWGTTRHRNFLVQLLIRCTTARNWRDRVLNSSWPYFLLISHTKEKRTPTPVSPHGPRSHADSRRLFCERTTRACARVSA
jgi:hypothetical protein